MTRKTALATALAVVLTVATASLAVAANLGLFNNEEPVGQLTPVTAPDPGDDPVVPTDAPTIYVDEQGNVLPTPLDGLLPADSGTDRTTVPVVGDDDASGQDDDRTDDEDERDEDEGEEDERDEHEDDEHEGRDDDD